MQYIEFKMQEDNTLEARIHNNGRVRVVRNLSNVEQLINCAKKYGYDDIKKSCNLKINADKIINDYDKKQTRRKNKVKVYNTLKDKFTLKRGNKGKAIIVSGFLIAGAIFYVFSNSNTDSVIDEPGIEIDTENEADNDSNLVEIIPNDNNSHNIVPMVANSKSFHCSFQSRFDDGTIDNAMEYKDLFVKYGNMYGIDADLLMAMVTQESNGDHFNFLNNGPAVGIMQIEEAAHIGEEVKAFNFDSNQEEKIIVSREGLEDLETNIKIGTMLLQNSLEKYNYNIPLAIQGYNFGEGNINKMLEACSWDTGYSIEELKNDSSNNSWLVYRQFLQTGDAKYLEHICSFLPPDKTLNFKKPNQEVISLNISNDYQKEKAI